MIIACGIPRKERARKEKYLWGKKSQSMFNHELYKSKSKLILVHIILEERDSVAFAYEWNFIST